MKMENEISKRDLNMQLEISNAQKNEFEETIGKAIFQFKISPLDADSLNFS